MVRHTVLVAAMCVLLGSLVEAQTTGEIEGSLVDGVASRWQASSSRPAMSQTDTPYSVTTNDLGRYRFTTLPPGTYEVTTAASPSLGPGILTVKVTMEPRRRPTSIPRRLRRSHAQVRRWPAVQAVRGQRPRRLDPVGRSEGAAER